MASEVMTCFVILGPDVANDSRDKFMVNGISPDGVWSPPSRRKSAAGVR